MRPSTLTLVMLNAGLGVFNLALKQPLNTIIGNVCIVTAVILVLTSAYNAPLE